jgi:hypothetical protein
LKMMQEGRNRSFPRSLRESRGSKKGKTNGCRPRPRRHDDRRDRRGLAFLHFHRSVKMRDRVGLLYIRRIPACWSHAGITFSISFVLFRLSSCPSWSQWPQLPHDPPAHPEQEGALVPATLFPPLWALNRDSLRFVFRLPQAAQAAGSSDWFIGRIRSNSRRQASQRYS